ncbi:MAG: acetyl-CoA hydrolase [Burkholderiaceae bacterium]|nr:acetyl-CoA hydrolase [Burkholderiaceae bacterium]
MSITAAPARRPLHLSVDECVDHIIEAFGRDIRFGMPLGLGKPVPLINALYRRVKADASLHLTIFTALSLEKPTWGGELERRFLQPFVERVWAGVPDLEFMRDLRRGGLPPNVRVHEIFFKAGAYRQEAAMQRDHICSNYTHVVRDCTINGNAVFAHIVARRETADGGVHYSASCNADTSLKTLRSFAEDQRQGEKRLRIAMVNPELPFMYGDAEVDGSMYDIVIDTPEGDYKLFSTPRLPVADADYLIGLHASALVKDGGTLQIGIGALGDAVAYALRLRHLDNAQYRQVLDATGIAARHGALIDRVGGTEPFQRGLYGSTEMLVDGFLQLYKSGITKRRVYQHAGIQALVNQGVVRDEHIPADVIDRLLEQELIPPYLARKDFEALQRHGVLREHLRWEDGEIVDGDERFSALIDRPANRQRLARCLGPALKNGVVLTGGFFIGPNDFYQTLRDMPEQERRLFEMTGVEVANQLYGEERLRALQRKDGRFCNTAMKATLLGNLVSDGYDDGWVVSGVGGQYNFVAMAHALPDARLVMMVKSTRHEGDRVLSNIVYNYGHVTIPRHLRDLVVTEYGIADLRGKSDQEVIMAMLAVTDSRFQDELLAEAKRHQKLPVGFVIPDAWRRNTPERLTEALEGFKRDGSFPPFPFGSEFSRVEMALAAALKALKSAVALKDPAELAALARQLPAQPPAGILPMLERMQLATASGPEELHLQRRTMLALRLAGMM